MVWGPIYQLCLLYVYAANNIIQLTLSQSICYIVPVLNLFSLMDPPTIYSMSSLKWLLPRIHELIGLSFPMSIVSVTTSAVNVYYCLSIAVGVVFLYCTVMWSYTVRWSYTILYCTMQLYDLVLYSSYMILYCTVQLYDLVLYSTVIWGIPTVTCTCPRSSTKSM